VFIFVCRRQTIIIGLVWLFYFSFTCFYFHDVWASEFQSYTISLEPQEFGTTGLASVVARVDSLSPIDSLTEPKVEFCWHESQSSLRSLDNVSSQYTLKRTQSAEPVVTVVAGGYSRIELVAKIMASSGVVYYAQADFNIFAREGSRSPVSVDQWPGWPFFELSSDQPLYWPQTGQTFLIKFHYTGLPPSPLTVWEEGSQSPSTVVAPNSDGLYTYVPPNDPQLNMLGPTASKRLVFVHPLADGGTASLCIFIHRSREEKRNLVAGLSVFGLSLAIMTGFLTLGRRRLNTWP
jgi:hypothetical protein